MSRPPGGRSGPGLPVTGPPPPPPPALFPDKTSANRGLAVAALGFLVGYLLAAAAVTALSDVSRVAVSGGRVVQTPAVVVVDLVGLWIGLVGAVVLASRGWGSGRPARDFGLRLRPWPDLPVGVAVGLASQFLLVPLVYLPLRPFLPHLTQTLAHPARQLTVHAHGVGFVILALFVAVGAPIVEEWFFRGLLLRALDHRLAGLGRRLGPVVAVVVTGVAFGLAHGEGFVLAWGLAAFGMVLGAMAEGFDRLGPGIVAHCTFNAATVVALALVR
ncbi:MAG: lysostaphin resistance A-like protein [Acidimicrobiales bacterium]